MIKEDYVSFEVAKLLKEKKFPRFICHKHYADGEGVWVGNFNKPTPDFKCGELVEVDCGVPTDGCEIDAPTIQMALKWLREEKLYYIQIMLDSWACGAHCGFYVVIQKTDSDFEMMLSDAVDDVFYETYETAANVALLYVLKELI